VASAFSPLDRQLQVPDKHWSEQVSKLAVWLSGLVPYEQAEQILARVGQITMSDSSLWRRVQRWGEACRTLEQAECQLRWTAPERPAVRRGEVPRTAVLGTALDGATVYVRTEGWKELKVGSLFQVAVASEVDPWTGERLAVAHAVHNSYVAYLGGPEGLGQRLWVEAQRRHWNEAYETVVLGDGAPWIWNLVAEHFYDSRQVVDWYHASQHLAQAAQALHGEGSAAAQRWYQHYETALFQGQAARIAEQLTQAAQHRPAVADALQREAGYFRKHQRRMQYQEVREEQLPIGSGMVESGCKQYRARFAGPGMRWGRPGLERLLPIRSAIMGQQFDRLWQAICGLPPN
jgi:hypothetical protein